VALVPLALSYELLPEDQSFYDELQEPPQPPQSPRTHFLALLAWLWRLMSGELPSHGDALLRFGAPRTLGAGTNLPGLLSEVQDQLVSLTSLSALHVRAISELLALPQAQVLGALQESGFPVRLSRLGVGMVLSDAERWALALQAATLLRRKLPKQWAMWLVEPILARRESELRGRPPTHLADVAPEPAAKRATSGDDAVGAKAPLFSIDKVVATLVMELEAAEGEALAAVEALRRCGVDEVTEEHLLRQLLQERDGRHCLPPPLARGAASIVAERLGIGSFAEPSAATPCMPSEVTPLWPIERATSKHKSNDEALGRWGFKDTQFVARLVDGRPAVRITSQRYGAIGGQPLFQLWSFFQTELGISMGVQERVRERSLPDLPPPAEGLVERLLEVVPAAHIHSDVEARVRAGTGHGLADIWRLRAGENLHRMPDIVVRPDTEEEVLAVLQAAKGEVPYAIVPVGGGTNVTSATNCPPQEVDARPFVALDMRGLCRVVWVNVEDRMALVEVGITGSALKDALSQKGVTMGMEPDSMEFSTLGGWIATRASGMKRARYGNIEDMILEVRTATPIGMFWQHHGQSACGSAADNPAFSRSSTSVELPGLALGSEGCLGVMTSAIVRVRPLPPVVEYQSAIFPDWEHGAAWMRSVAHLPAAMRPASCRLMDQKQLRLSRALREEEQGGGLRAILKEAVLRFRGVDIEKASAVTILFEGSRAEVALQKRALGELLGPAGGQWGGAGPGEAGYALTFAIAYLRDFGLDYRILSESLETLAPWSAVAKVWPMVLAAVTAEHQALRLPGKPFLSLRMTQIYDEGAVLYMYLAVSTAGLTSEHALRAFERLEQAARQAVLEAGGCLSHHHGTGKLRGALLPQTQASLLSTALHELKAAVDPENALGARNGVWSQAPCSSEPCLGQP